MVRAWMLPFSGAALSLALLSRNFGRGLLFVVAAPFRAPIFLAFFVPIKLHVRSLVAYSITFLPGMLPPRAIEHVANLGSTAPHVFNRTYYEGFSINFETLKFGFGGPQRDHQYRKARDKGSPPAC